MDDLIIQFFKLFRLLPTETQSGCLYGLCEYLFPWFGPPSYPLGYFYLSAVVCGILVVSLTGVHVMASQHVIAQWTLLGTLAYFLLLAIWYRTRAS